MFYCVFGNFRWCFKCHDLAVASCPIIREIPDICPESFEIVIHFVHHTQNSVRAGGRGLPAGSKGHVAGRDKLDVAKLQHWFQHARVQHIAKLHRACSAVESEVDVTPLDRHRFIWRVLAPLYKLAHLRHGMNTGSYIIERPDVEEIASLYQASCVDELKACVHWILNGPRSDRETNNVVICGGLKRQWYVEIEAAIAATRYICALCGPVVAEGHITRLYGYDGLLSAPHVIALHKTVRTIVATIFGPGVPVSAVVVTHFRPPYAWTHVFFVHVLTQLWKMSVQSVHGVRKRQVFNLTSDQLFDMLVRLPPRHALAAGLGAAELTLVLLAIACEAALCRADAIAERRRLVGAGCRATRPERKTGEPQSPVQWNTAVALGPHRTVYQTLPVEQARVGP